MVAAAREEEIGYIKKLNVYRRVHKREAEAKGAKIIQLRWIDTNKGTEESPQVRSRLVAKDFKQGGEVRHDLFAATPPLEALKVLLSHLADAPRRQGGGD
eukprot:2535639-Karenia_brevis.AAC.1